MNQARKLALALQSRPVSLSAPASASAPAGADDEWLDVKALFRILRRRYLTALLVFVGVTALAAIPIMDMKRVYTAEATVLMRDPAGAGLVPSDPQTQKPLNLSTEIARLLSRDISVRVIQEVGLETRPEFNAALSEPSLPRQAITALKQVLGLDPNATGTGSEPDLDDLRLVMPAYKARLAVFQQGNSDVVNIGFSSEDAALAATVTNTVIQTYLQARERQSRSDTEAYADWLAKRIEQQKARLQRTLDAVAARRAQPDLSSPSALGVDAAIASLSERRLAIRLDLEAAERALEELRADGAGASAYEDAENESGAALTLALQTAKAELALVLQDLGPNHSKARELRQRIADMEARVQFQVSSQIHRLTNRIKTLQAEDRSTFVELEAARETLATERYAEIELAQLERQVEQEQTLLASLDQQRRALLSFAERPTTEVSVLTPATVPLTADGRGKAFYLVVAMIGALLAAITAVLGREILDTSVRSAENLRRIHRVSPAGIVPALSRRRPSARGPLAWWRDDRVFADAVRGVTISIERAFQGHFPQSILVSSALPREGKTTVAAALAVELAASGRRVLLVDCDLHHGDLHMLFRQMAGPGLSDYLSGTHGLADIVQPQVAPLIDLVGRGSGTGGARLDQRKIASLLRMATDAGQIVVLDTPPALATVDTASLSDLVECRILVVEWGRTQPDAVEAAVQRMALGSDSDVFVVINRVNLRRQAMYGFRDGGPLARTLRSYHGKKPARAEAVARRR